jgi:hypothetical protein
MTSILLLFPLAAAAASTPTASCEAVTRLALPLVTIASAQSVPAGPLALPQGLPATATVPAFCRVAGTIKPSADSDIRFEVWLPASGWNGKFKGWGNGGYAGGMSWARMARAASLGYATASTDTGHSGSGIDASWALGHPEKVLDYGYRAIHEMTVAAKAIAAAYYGRPVRRSYFYSCSNGGRQALMEAQRFPDDYDGLVAAAPANEMTRLFTQGAWNRLATEGDAASYVPASKIPALEAATLAQCDASDGVKDGVVDDPSACSFRPASLLCSGADSDGCLTAAQVAALDKLYIGPRTAAGAQVHPGLVAGGTDGPAGWLHWITGTEPGKGQIGTYGTQFFKYMVYEDPNWDFRTFQVDRDAKAADAKLAHILNASDPDLSAFRRRGGKLIVWHGWSDAAISALNSIKYYEAVKARMGARETDEFLRLFMAPGVQHCDQGPGPTGFVGPSALKPDALHDMDLAVERWVEEGVAPAQIIAAKYKTFSDPASGLVRTRPLCPYPQVARYTGSGSTDEAANFVCREAAEKR